MTYSRTSFCLILLLSFVSFANPALAADDTTATSVDASATAASLSVTPASPVAASPDAYQELKTTVLEDLKRLQELGGGIKPFENRIAELDQIKANGQSSTAVSQLNSLSTSIKEQLKSLSDLRFRKPIAKPKSASNGHSVTSDVLVLLTSNPKSLEQNISPMQAQQLQQMFSDTNFQGNGQEYIQKVAQDIIAREFGGMGIPCRGPFQLERFRNLHRMNELRKQGKDIRNFLSYHNQTEQLAARAPREPGVVAELSQRVRYLEQQLGLAPLTAGKSGIRQF